MKGEVVSAPSLRTTVRFIARHNRIQYRRCREIGLRFPSTRAPGTRTLRRRPQQACSRTHRESVGGTDRNLRTAEARRPHRCDQLTGDHAEKKSAPSRPRSCNRRASLDRERLHAASDASPMAWARAAAIVSRSGSPSDFAMAALRERAEHGPRADAGARRSAFRSNHGVLASLPLSVSHPPYRTIIVCHARP